MKQRRASKQLAEHKRTAVSSASCVSGQMTGKQAWGGGQGERHARSPLVAAAKQPAPFWWLPPKNLPLIFIHPPLLMAAKGGQSLTPGQETAQPCNGACTPPHRTYNMLWGGRRNQLAAYMGWGQAALRASQAQISPQSGPYPKAPLPASLAI